MAEDSKSGSISGSNVFVSYSRLNLDFANQIVALLEDEGYDPKIDREDIEATERWEARLEELISSSDTVVFVLTDEYVSSPNCMWEIDQAVSRSKRLIPIVPKPLTVENVPVELAKLNYIYFFNLKEGDGTGFYAGVKSLKRALRHDLERLRLRRRYEDKAKAWGNGEDDLLSADQLEQAETWLMMSKKMEGVPEFIADYIMKSRAAQDRRIKNQRRLTLAFSVISVIALIATASGVFSWWMAREKEVVANLAIEKQQQAESILGLTGQWGAARASLALNPFEVGDDLDISSENYVDPTQIALSQLEIINTRMQEQGVFDATDTTKEIQDIWDDMRRDLAKARFYNGKENAVDPIDDILAESGVDGTTDITQLDTQLLPNLVGDYVSRALYSCLRSDRISAIGVELEQAPSGLLENLHWSSIERRAQSDNTCAEAIESICAYATGCPFENEDVPNRGPMEEIIVADNASEVARGDDAEGFAQAGPLPPPVASQGPRPDPVIAMAKDTPYKITQVFLHICDESERADAEIFKAELEKRYPHLKVLGIELVKARSGVNRSVRYYYEAQQAQAAELVSICAEIAGVTGRSGWQEASSYRRISLAGRYENLPTNRVEIWF